MNLLVVQGPNAGATYPLREGENAAGRDEGCEVHLQSMRVSRRHCVFHVQADACVVQDLGSSNGILVNGHRMDACTLVDGTHIQVGDVMLVYQLPQAVPDVGSSGEFTRKLEDVDDADDHPTIVGKTPSELMPDGGAATMIRPSGGFGGGGEQTAWSGDDPGATPVGGTPVSPPAKKVRNLAAQPVEESPPFAPAESGFGAPAEGGFGAPAEGGFGAPAESGFGAPATGGFGAAPEGGFGNFGAQPGLGGSGLEPQDMGYVEDEDMRSITRTAVDLGQEEPESRGPLSKVPWGGRLLGVFIVASLILLCGPLGGFFSLLSSSSSGLEDMAVERGKAVAEGLGHRNAKALAKRAHLDLDLTPVLSDPGVKSSMLVDTKGVVLAPSEKVNTSLRGSTVFASVLTERRPVAVQEGDTWTILAPARAAVVDGAPGGTVVGYAYITYDAAGVASQAGRPWLRGIASLLWLGLAMGVAMVLVRRLTLNPIVQLREETELAVKGDIVEVGVSERWKQLEELAHSINRAVLRGGAGAPAPAALKAPPAPVPDERLPAMLAACAFPVFMLDRQQRVTDANDWALHLLGTPREQAIGASAPQLVPEGELKDKLLAMLSALSQGQAPALSDVVNVGGEQRRVTVAGKAAGGQLEHAVVVVA